MCFALKKKTQTNKNPEHLLRSGCREIQNTGGRGEVLPDSNFGAPSLRRPSSAPAWSPAGACAGAGAGPRRSAAASDLSAGRCAATALSSQELADYCRFQIFFRF